MVSRPAYLELLYCIASLLIRNIFLATLVSGPHLIRVKLPFQISSFEITGFALNNEGYANIDRRAVGYQVAACVTRLLDIFAKHLRN